MSPIASAPFLIDRSVDVGANQAGSECVCDFEAKIRSGVAWMQTDTEGPAAAIDCIFL